MSKLTVAVLFGGQSSEHEVSRMSATTILSNMDPEKYYIIPVGITKAGQWMIYNGPVEKISTGEWETFGTPAVLSPDASQKGILRLVGGKVKEIPIDVAFPVLHGLYGEDGTIQGLLELAKIPYVGCGVLSSAVSMDKTFTKIIAKHARIPHAAYVALQSKDRAKPQILRQIERKLGYPVFVKPANAGSSVGVSRAADRQQLEQALEVAAKEDWKILVEREIRGREVECAVLGDHTKAEASGVGEILSAGKFYDYHSKYEDENSRTVIPADLPEETVKTIRRLAVKVFESVDGCGLARVDFFVEEGTNQVIFNELNTMPGFTSISMYPKLWEERGLALPDLIDRLIELAMQEAQRMGHYHG